MMKTIIALLLASFASAFKPSKAFLGFGGLASASKYDPKIFEDASAAADAFPIEQVGERRLSFMDAVRSYQSGNSWIHDNPYYCKPECKMCMSGGSWDGGVPVVDGICRDYCSVNGYCGVADVYKAGGTDCTPCSSCPVNCMQCRPGGSHDGGVDLVDGQCHYFCSFNGFCGVGIDYVLDGISCAECWPSSSTRSRRARGSSLSIIIPVVIAAVLLLAAVLYLVRKRRVAAATPDETPQLDTEIQVEA